MGTTTRTQARSLLPAIALSLLLLRCFVYGEDDVPNAPAPAPVADAGADTSLTNDAGFATDEDAGEEIDPPDDILPEAGVGCFEGGSINESVDQAFFERWQKVERAGGAIAVTTTLSSFPPASLYATGSDDKDSRAYAYRDVCPSAFGTVRCELDLQINKIGVGNIGVIDVLGRDGAYARVKTSEIQFHSATPDAAVGPQKMPLNLRALPQGQFHRINLQVTSGSFEVSSPTNSAKVTADVTFAPTRVRFGLIFHSGTSAALQDRWDIHVDELRCVFGPE